MAHKTTHRTTLKLGLLLAVLLASFGSRAAEAPTAFIKLADQTARLDLEQEQAAANWAGMARRFLSAEGLNSEAFKSGKLRTPERYYSLPLVERNKLKKINPKLVHLEGYYTEKEYKKLMAQLGPLKKEVQQKRKELTASELKQAITEFHQSKMDMLPESIDIFIGLDYASIEDSLDKSLYTYDALIGWTKKVSQSDYADLKIIFQHLRLKESDIFYDLGSGYGRVALYGGAIHPGTTFKGIELVRERAEYAQTLADSLELKNVKSIPGDVLKENFDDGTVFYMFHPFPSIMREFVPKLRKIAQKRQIKIIALGITAVELQHTDWLEIEKDLMPDRHHYPVVVYRSKP